mmetsp:Transcript_12391/g.24660  ORF Transcript_12391/g.24660 Transcript_12391/m.24660 type:complete len:228 (-) Transcript_12391:1730-2413(-)
MLATAAAALSPTAGSSTAVCRPSASFCAALCRTSTRVIQGEGRRSSVVGVTGESVQRSRRAAEGVMDAALFSLSMLKSIAVPSSTRAKTCSYSSSPVSMKCTVTRSSSCKHMPAAPASRKNSSSPSTASVSCPSAGVEPAAFSSEANPFRKPSLVCTESASVLMPTITCSETNSESTCASRLSHHCWKAGDCKGIEPEISVVDFLFALSMTSNTNSMKRETSGATSR